MSPFSAFHKNLPTLGVGLGLRHSLLDEIMANRSRIDFLEIIPENHMGRGGIHRHALEECIAAGFPIVSHGVGLSLGSTDPLDEDYLKTLEALFSWMRPQWFSDHLSFSSVDNVHLHDLLPLPFTREAVDHVVQRIKTIQQRFDIPFLIENITYYTQFDHAEMTEAQFISDILEQADCGMLLDVNNVYVNCENHGGSPHDFLDAIPLERVVQIHVAGHLVQQDLIIDTHGEAVIFPVYDVLDTVLKKGTPVKGILLERDSNFPPMEDLLGEMDQIRGLASRHQHPVSPKKRVVAA